MSRSIYQLSQTEPITHLSVVAKTRRGRATHAFSNFISTGDKKNWSLCQREIVELHRDQEPGHPGWDALSSELTCKACQMMARRTKIYVVGREF